MIKHMTLQIERTSEDHVKIVGVGAGTLRVEGNFLNITLKTSSGDLTLDLDILALPDSVVVAAP